MKTCDILQQQSKDRWVEAMDNPKPYTSECYIEISDDDYGRVTLARLERLARALRKAGMAGGQTIILDKHVAEVISELEEDLL